MRALRSRVIAWWGLAASVAWLCLVVEQRFHVVWGPKAAFQSTSFSYQQPAYYDWPPSLFLAAVLAVLICVWRSRSAVVYRLWLICVSVALVLVAASLYNAVAQRGSSPLLFEGLVYARPWGWRTFGDPFARVTLLEGSAQYGWQHSFFARQVVADRCYAASMILLVATATAVAVGLRRRTHRSPGHCRHCAYDLRGSIGKRCPECGAEIEETRRVAHLDASRGGAHRR